MASKLERGAGEGGGVAMDFLGNVLFQRGPWIPLLTALGLTFFDNAARKAHVKRLPVLKRQMFPTGKREFCSSL